MAASKRSPEDLLFLFFQVLDAVSGALIGAFTWWNLGFVAPALAFVYKRKLPVSLCTSMNKFGFMKAPALLYAGPTVLP
jgi:hypothetical protein